MRANPPTAIIIAAAAGVAVLGLVAGGVAYVHHKRKVVVPPPVTPPKGPGGGGGGKVQNYVGSGWDWPKKYKYPTEQSFGAALENLGYGNWDYHAADFTVLHGNVMQSVKEFQADWNSVYKTLEHAPQIHLGVDGLIGKNTITALEYAEGYEDAPASVGWANYVHQMGGVS